MKIALDKPKKASRSSWLSTVPLTALAVFPAPRGSVGDLSIVYLPTTPPPERDQARVEFDPRSAFLLNRGKGEETLFVFGGATGEDAAGSEIAIHRYGPAIQHDEADFKARLNELPPTLRDVGKSLLSAAREIDPGGYFQRTSSGRYVNRPDNFWTIKIQPRDQSFRITVRGRPDRFEGIRGLNVKPDQNGYSGFKVGAAKDLAAATAALKLAREK